MKSREQFCGSAIYDSLLKQTCCKALIEVLEAESKTAYGQLMESLHAWIEKEVEAQVRGCFTQDALNRQRDIVAANLAKLDGLIKISASK